MQIFIAKAGKTTGPFSEDQIRSMLNSGMIDPADSAWHDGLTSWLPLHQMLKVSSPLSQPPPPPPQAMGYGVGAVTSKAAITSLVCGILGFFLLGLPAMVGLPVGIFALRAIKKSGGRMQGTGLAIAGIVCSALGLVILFGLILAIAIPNFVKARGTAQQNICISNLRACLKKHES